MSEELKPCPFCGHEAVATQYIVGGKDVVQCTFCSVRTQATDSRREAIRDWNTRPLEDALHTSAKNAEAKLADYMDGIDRILDDEGAQDEIHCGCVPVLRNRIAELEQMVERLVEVGEQGMYFVDGVCDGKHRELPEYWYDWQDLTAEYRATKMGSVD